MTDTHAPNTTGAWWRGLGRDWQAVLFGLGLLFVVLLGVWIPW